MTPLYLQIVERQTRAMEAQTRILDELLHTIRAVYNLPAHRTPPDRAPYQATLRDLASVSPDDAQSLADARTEVAQQQGSFTPGSTAEWEAVKAYEEAVVAQFGEEARADLPWNRIRTADKAQGPGSSSPQQRNRA